MIREIAREVTAHLRARGVPLEVVVDESSNVGTNTFARERAVLAYAEGPASDRFGEVRSQRSRDQQYFTAQNGYVLTIYAKSPVSGALPFEHQRRARKFLTQLLIAFTDVAVIRRNSWSPTAGGFVPTVDLEASEKPGGARYVLSFTFDQGIIPCTWNDELAPTVTFGAGPDGVSISSTTKVSSAEANADMTAPPLGATTSCGG